MTSEFQLHLKELLGLIKNYQKQLKQLSDNNELIANNYQNYYIKLKAVFSIVQKALNQGVKIDNCKFYATLIHPISNPIYLPKCEVRLKVQAKERCSWFDQDMELTFAALIENRKTITRTIIIHKDQLSFEGNDLQGIVRFELQFEGEEKFVDINYSNNLINIQYNKYTALKLDTPSNALKTKESFNPLYAKSNFREQIKEVFPKARFIINDKADWKSMVVPESIKEDLETTMVVELPSNLETLTEQELDQLNLSINSRKTALTSINKVLIKTLERYESFEFNYEGDKTEVFDDSYHQTIQNAHIAVDAIIERLKILDDSLAKVLEADRILKEEALLLTSPFLTAAKEVSKKLKVFWTEIQEIVNRFDNYDELTLNYEDWAKEINDTTVQIASLKENLPKVWIELSSTERTTKNEKEKFEKIKTNYEDLQDAILNLEKNDFFKRKKEGLESAGDGFLEYKKGEDSFSKEEKKEFGLTDQQKESLDKSGGKIEFTFKKPDLPLFDKENGVELEDIKQGQVGDCYLLAALANLTTGSDRHLIREMIEENDNLYTVTLYQNGIPVKVEVDKKLMIREIEQKNIIGNKVTKETFIGNTPDNDIWVSIIEKAYAKLMADGEFTDDNVDGGLAKNAMKILLGDKVKQPREMYLDENGNLSDIPTENKFQNPVTFANTSETQLQQIILSAIQNGYKINVASPSTYKGGTELTDQHLLDIGAGNYMTFHHVYTIIEANEKNITLFNPHGKNEDLTEKKIFDKKTKKAYDKLAALLPAKGKLLPETKEAIEVILNKNELIRDETTRVMGNLRAKIGAIADTNIAKGFITQEINILDRQKILYSILKEHFKDLIITIIKK